MQLGSSTRYLVTNVPTKGIFNAKFANFDRIASVPITTDNLAMADFCGLNANGSYRYDNYGGCGTDAVGSFVKRNVGIDLGDGSHSLRFQYSPIDAPGGNPNAAGTSYIKVYHPNATTWQIAPEFPATGAFLTNSGSPSLQNVPFSFTVTRP